MMLRVGQGWDLHRLVPGRELRLGGIAVPFDRGLLGHSDGDAVLHAVCDALLGAIAAGDIGMQFPDSDPQYRGIDSAVLLERVAALVRDRGYAVRNIDVTVLAEQPRLSSHLPHMQARIGALLGIDTACVSLKAKTQEGLGAIGRGEAIGALAITLVERPD